MHDFVPPFHLLEQSTFVQLHKKPLAKYKLDVFHSELELHVLQSSDMWCFHTSNPRRKKDMQFV